jgi:hypothetical protein
MEEQIMKNEDWYKLQTPASNSIQAAMMKNKKKKNFGNGLNHNFNNSIKSPPNRDYTIDPVRSFSQETSNQSNNQSMVASLREKLRMSAFSVGKSFGSVGKNLQKKGYPKFGVRFLKLGNMIGHLAD